MLSPLPEEAGGYCPVSPPNLRTKRGVGLSSLPRSYPPPSISEGATNPDQSPLSLPGDVEAVNLSSLSHRLFFPSRGEGFATSSFIPPSNVGASGFAGSLSPIRRSLPAPSGEGTWPLLSPARCDGITDPPRAASHSLPPSRGDGTAAESPLPRGEGACLSSPACGLLSSPSHVLHEVVPISPPSSEGALPSPPSRVRGLSPSPPQEVGGLSSSPPQEVRGLSFSPPQIVRGLPSLHISSRREGNMRPLHSACSPRGVAFSLSPLPPQEVRGLGSPPLQDVRGLSSPPPQDVRGLSSIHVPSRRDGNMSSKPLRSACSPRGVAFFLSPSPPQEVRGLSSSSSREVKRLSSSPPQDVRGLHYPPRVRKWDDASPLPLSLPPSRSEGAAASYPCPPSPREGPSSRSEEGAAPHSLFPREGPLARPPSGCEGDDSPRSADLPSRVEQRSRKRTRRSNSSSSGGRHKRARQIRSNKHPSKPKPRKRLRQLIISDFIEPKRPCTNLTQNLRNSKPLKGTDCLGANFPT